MAWYTVFLLCLFESFHSTETIYMNLNEVEDSIIRDIINIYKHVPVEIRDTRNESINVSHIKFDIYSGNHPKQRVTIAPYEPIVFPKQSTIVFLIHGWLDNSRSSSWIEMKDAILKKYPLYIVIEVNWSVYAAQGYFVAAHDVKDVGGIVGKFIVNLNKIHSIPMDHFLLIGHSLGAQVAGFTGKKVTELTGIILPRIVALDVAGPEFYKKPDSERLNKDDAEVVVVIHTSGDTFGFKDSCGTIDFFPNGGDYQPGCLRVFLHNLLQFSLNVGCSHGRSKYYFTAALLRSEKFLARKCDSWKTYITKPNLCQDVYLSMGDLESAKIGNFYSNTTDVPPYYK